MDEPTNHLDLSAIEWLEEYLSGPNITLIMVTHDRYFLDNVANEIIELDRGKLFRYKGNYAYSWRRNPTEKKCWKTESFQGKAFIKERA